jgi:uncharacterized membrane protein
MNIDWNALLWFLHILGIALWLGSSIAALLVWPHPADKEARKDWVILIHSLRRLISRASLYGGLLVAISGTSLSLIVQPKSELATVWLTTMQGLGVVAFILALFVLPRIDRSLFLQDACASSDAFDRAQKRYHRTLVVIVLLLLLCLLMAAFKPT